MGLKSGGAKWEFETYSVKFETYLVKFETYLVKFETYLVKRDYETKKTAGALEPPEPPSLAPMYMYIYGENLNEFISNSLEFFCSLKDKGFGPLFWEYWRGVENCLELNPRKIQLPG